MFGRDSCMLTIIAIGCTSYDSKYYLAKMLSEVARRKIRIKRRDERKGDSPKTVFQLRSKKSKKLKQLLEKNYPCSLAFICELPSNNT